jgi:hypothetical protein
VHPDIRQTAGRDDDTYNYYLKLMAQPGLASKNVGIVYDYVGMRVVDGPVEKDGITWWKLEGHGKAAGQTRGSLQNWKGNGTPRLKALLPGPLKISEERTTVTNAWVLSRTRTGTEG